MAARFVEERIEIPIVAGSVKNIGVIMKTKSALSYFGSDSEVAGELAAMLDHCKHVTIPFVGGAAILSHLKARAIVGNDRNGLGGAVRAL